MSDKHFNRTVAALQPRSRVNEGNPLKENVRVKSPNLIQELC